LQNTILRDGYEEKTSDTPKGKASRARVKEVCVRGQWGGGSHASSLMASSTMFGCCRLQNGTGGALVPYTFATCAAQIDSHSTVMSVKLHNGTSGALYSGPARHITTVVQGNRTDSFMDLDAG